MTNRNSFREHSPAKLKNHVDGSNTEEGRRFTAHVNKVAGKMTLEESRRSMQFQNDTFGKDGKLPEWDGNKWNLPDSDEEEGDDEDDGRGIFCGICVSRNNPRKGANPKQYGTIQLRKKGYLEK